MCQKHGNVRSGKSLLLRELLPTDQMWRLPYPAKSPRRNAGDFSYLFVKRYFHNFMFSTLSLFCYEIDNCTRIFLCKCINFEI